MKLVLKQENQFFYVLFHHVIFNKYVTLREFVTNITNIVF
ncbi:hypothetical protein B4168_2984 [Anoxybacillus flavithermus]|nr:hypothetical protein B4168_2984 [Anoxybacillus flavithermus]OAO86273.1 hypothetical protein GT23_2166 [Parageobacillus thermoglucosidasius]